MAKKYPGLLTTQADKEQALYAGLMGMGQGMAGGYSNMPVSFMQQFAKGGKGFQTEYDKKIAQGRQNQIDEQGYQANQAQIEAQQMQIEDAKSQRAKAALAKTFNDDLMKWHAAGADPATMPTNANMIQQKYTQDIKAFADKNPVKPQTIKTAKGVFILNPDGTMGKRLGDVHQPGPTVQITNRGLPVGWEMDPDTNTARPIRKGPEDPVVIKQKEDAKRASKQAEQMPGIRKGIVTKMDRLPILKRTVDEVKALSEGWLTSGVPGQIMAGISSSDQYEMNAKMTTLKSAVGLNELIEIKKAGGTFGALSDTELALLISSAGSLDTNLGPDVLGPIMDDVIRLYEKGINTMKSDFSTRYPDATVPWKNGEWGIRKK